MFKIVLQNNLAGCLNTRYCNLYYSSKLLLQISSHYTQKKHASTQTKAASKPSQIVTLIPGDGIGPEMMHHVQTVIK